MSFVRLYGHEALSYADEGGDDLDAALNRHEDGYRMLSVMRNMNFKASAIKQMVAAKVEFFRNTITTEGVYASPIRALTTFVNGKWEGTGSVPVKERVGAILDQVGKLRRRGVESSFCSAMAVISLSHWCRIKTGEEWLDLPPTVIHGRLEDNGFGVPDSGGNVWVLKDRVPDPVVRASVGTPPGTLVTSDMISVLAREVRGLNITLSVSREKVAELAAASFDAYDRCDYTNVFAFKTECLGVEPVVSSRKNEAAWLDMVEWLGLEKRATRVGSILRYEELIPYMRVGDRAVTREDLAAVFGVSDCLDVLDFQGDVYYRRLIAEPLAKVVTEFCMEMVAQGVRSLSDAEEIFKDLCWMAYVSTEFML
jgi:hypothetical protein